MTDTEKDEALSGVAIDPMVSEISIYEAAARGISRLRKKVWAIKEDHLKIDIFDGKPGPWTHLFSPFNKSCNGRDPVDIFMVDLDYAAKEFVPYLGPLPESDEYKKKAMEFNRFL